MKYRPITSRYTPEIINDLEKYLESTDNTQTTIDTLDLCHLLGEIERLNDVVNKIYAEKLKLLKYKRFIFNIVITPVDWKNPCRYQLHNYTKQNLYRELFQLRKEIIEELKGVNEQ